MRITLAPSVVSSPAGSTPLGSPPSSDAGPDLGIDLPFSIEPGMALGLGGRFFATALRHDPQGSMALLARLPLGAPSSPAAIGVPPAVPGVAVPPEAFELGRSEGDVPPPRLAADGKDLWVALEAPVAGGYQIRIARWSGAELAGPLALPPPWRDGPRTSRDESNAFDLAASEGRAIVVWDDWPAGESHGRVFLFALEPAERSRPAPVPEAVPTPAALPRPAALPAPAALPLGGVPPRAVSAPGVDAEEPRVVARPGGYWMAWLVNSVLAPAGSPPAAPGPAATPGGSRIYDPGEGETEAPAAASKPRDAARYIEVVALDGAGSPTGQVRRLGPEQGRVVGYDLSTTTAGNAWLVWRQDAPSPGAAGGRVLMAEVRNDGARDVLPVREEDVGSGEPSWLGSGSGTPPWLTFPDQRDRTLLLPVQYPLPMAPPLALDAELGAASALAAAGGQVLFARPRGRALELFVASCSAPPRPVAVGRDGG